MSILTGNVTAAATAAVLYRNHTGAPNCMTLTTHGNSADVYIGGSNVTSSSNGVVIPKSTTLQITVPAGETLWCAGNGTDTCRYFAFV
jgi:hypothetical protein